MVLNEKLPRDSNHVAQLKKNACIIAGIKNVDISSYDNDPPYHVKDLVGDIYAVLFSENVPEDVAHKVSDQVMLPFRPTWEVAQFHTWIESKRISHAIDFLEYYPELIHSENEFGCTPIHTAAIWDSTLLIEELYSRGADVNHIDCEGNTALIDAAEHGHCKSVQVLIKLGANILIKNRGGKSALDTARLHQFSEVVEILEKVALSIH